MADDVYVRFHGIKTWYRHDYSDDELLFGRSISLRAELRRRGLFQQ
jgi:hypothetical protein